MLDNPNLRQEVKDYLEPKLPDFMWSNRVLKWFDNWSMIEDLKTISETESYDKIVEFVRQRKSVTKKEIIKHMGGWGLRIKWTPYRNRLRNEKDIRLTKNRYEVIEK